MNVDYSGCFIITLTASMFTYLALALTATATAVAVVEVEKETHFIENGITAIFEEIEDGFESIDDFVNSLFTSNSGGIIQSSQNGLVNDFSYININSIDFTKYYVFSKKYDPWGRPGQKKQGRELKNKARERFREQDKFRGGRKKTKKHTPGRGHKKYIQLILLAF